MPLRTSRWLGAFVPILIATTATLSLASSWSCSDDADPMDKSSAAVCKAPIDIEVAALTARPEPGWYEAKATAKGKSLTLRLELNGSADTPLTPGSYSLGGEGENDYASCTHCVLLFEGDDLEQASKVYFAAAGTVVIDAISTPVGASSRGSLHGLRLREVTLDAETSSVKTKSGGSCYALEELAWNNDPEPGAACQRASDCGDPTVAACDPSGRCVVRQCSFDDQNPCPDGAICLAQTIEASAGACFQLCSPKANDCPTGLECLPLDAGSTQGRCVGTGATSEGGDCDETPANTGCAPGLRCVNDGDGGLDTTAGNPVCRQRCDFFGTGGCPTGSRCAYGDYCTPLEYDQAEVDAPCGVDTEAGTPCGPDASAYRGLCVPAPELSNQILCRRACTTEGADLCPESQYCGDVEGDAFVASVCRPFVADGEVQP